MTHLVGDSANFMIRAFCASARAKVLFAARTLYRLCRSRVHLGNDPSFGPDSQVQRGRSSCRLAVGWSPRSCRTAVLFANVMWNRAMPVIDTERDRYDTLGIGSFLAAFLGHLYRTRMTRCRLRTISTFVRRESIRTFFVHEWWISEWNEIKVLPEYQRANGTSIDVYMTFW